MRTVARVALLLVAVVVCAASSKKPSEKQSKSVEKEQAEMKVTAAEILSNHDENPLRWDQRFRGKVVEVTGVIKNIEHSAISDDPVIKIEAPPKPANPDAEDAEEEFSFDRVTCYLADSQVSKAVELKVGEQITVKGRVKDWSLGADLSPCVLP
jgi:hypothetical protein